MRVFLLAGVFLTLSLVLTACNEANDHAGGHAMETGIDMMDDQMFVVGMIEHHQGAIDMAEIALERAEHNEITALAEEIIEVQEAEIEQMDAWHRAWFDEDPTHFDHGMDADDMGMGMNMADLETVDPFDQAFIDAMIPHHEGAIHMAEQILETTDRPELRQLAEEIITAQRAEIEQMREWRREWYGQ